MVKEIRFGINGFGRVGRMLLREAQERPGMRCVAVNEAFTPAGLMAHLFKYDSTHGKFGGSVRHDDNSLSVNGKDIRVLSLKNPADIRWGDLGADIVFETTGILNDKEKAKAHLNNGAKKVIASYNVKNAVTIIMGVNHDVYDPKRDDVISGSTNLLNCIAPVAKVLDDYFGIEWGITTAVVPVTSFQRVLDYGTAGDVSRSVFNNIIPNISTSMNDIGTILPSLQNKFKGSFIRVPINDVMLVDLVAEMKGFASTEDVNNALIEASQGHLKGIVGYSNDDLVSSDFLGSTFSAVVHARSTITFKNKVIKIQCWQDNEIGYVNRMLDIAQLVAKGMRTRK